MRNDWRNILGEKLELSKDVQFDIQLANFFENLIYINTDSNDNVIVRCVENNKDYILKFNSNRLYLEYIVNECEYDKRVRKLLYFLNYEEIDEKDNLTLNRQVTKFKEDVKIYYKDYDLLEKESRYDVTEIVSLFETKGNILKDYIKEEFASSTLKKIHMPLQIKSKWVVPDIHATTEVYRNENGTRVCPYIKKGNTYCFSEPYKADNMLPTLELATRSANDVFENQERLFAKKNYVKYKRKKIGFI